MSVPSQFHLSPDLSHADKHLLYAGPDVSLSATCLQGHCIVHGHVRGWYQYTAGQVRIDCLNFEFLTISQRVYSAHACLTGSDG